MKIVFYEIEDWQKPLIERRLKGHDLAFFEDAVNPQTQEAPDGEVLCCFVNSRVDASVLAKMPSLKFIATRTTGFDHIDIAAAQTKNIPVSNVPSYGENTVAEFAFALILSLARKIYPAVKRVREQGLFSYEGLRGFDLKNKTLGVIGTGRIGAHAIRIAKGFEMNVLAYDPRPNSELAGRWQFNYVDLAELIKQSDVVTIHVPYMPETHHLIDAEKLKLFKPSAILVNTSRGGLVDTAALTLALRTKQLAGAALDVLEEEGFVVEEMNLLNGHPNEQQLKTVLCDHELMQMENVLVTPHNGFNTLEALERILNTTMENIEGFINNQPINMVKNN